MKILQGKLLEFITRPASNFGKLKIWMLPNTEEKGNVPTTCCITTVALEKQ
jgi:hypothetical protein